MGERDREPAILQKALRQHDVAIGIGAFSGLRYRLLDRPVCRSVDIDYHWTGDPETPQKELAHLLERRLLPNICRRLNFDGSVSAPPAGSPARHHCRTRLLEARVSRYVPGKYGLPAGVTVEDLVMAIDSDAHVTAAAALAQHGLITQVPPLVERFMRQRHNRSRERHSPLGTLVFTCIALAVHGLPEGGPAGPGRASCDLVFMSRRRRYTKPARRGSRATSRGGRKARPRPRISP